LKNLATLVEIGEAKSLQDVLLVDDSPVKNLLNHVNNVVYPPTYSGESGDTFLSRRLQPWLEGLFASNEAVTDYVKANPLRGGQRPMDPLSFEAIRILRGV